MSSENLQGYLWIPCEFYSSLANQIMCNKQSALELWLPFKILYLIAIAVAKNHHIKFAGLRIIVSDILIGEI